MSKFNESVQIEETTLYQTGELMSEVNNTEEDFQLTAPAGENQDEDSLGELSTNEAIEVAPFDNFHPLNATKISPRWADGSKRTNWNI